MTSTRKATLVAVVAVASISLLPSTAQAKPWTTPVGATPSGSASHHSADHAARGSDRLAAAEVSVRQPATPPSSLALDRAPRFRFERFPT